MLEIKDIKKALSVLSKTEKGQEVDVAIVIKVAKAVSQILEKRHRYTCGIESLEINENGNGVGFFLSPDGQNGEFYYALIDVGFRRHFYQAEYHWGVRKGDIVLTYTEGDLSVYKVQSHD